MAKQGRGCFTFIALGVFVVIALIVAVYVILANGRSTASDRIEAIRERGEPTSLDELNEYYATLDGPNAAPLFLEAMNALKGLSREDRTMLFDGVLPDGEPVFPEDGAAMSEAARAAVEQFVSSQAETSALIAEAVELVEARFPVDFADITDTRLSHLSGMRQLTRWTVFEALAKAHADEAEAATDALVNAFGTVEALKGYPSMLAALTRAAMVGIAVGGFADAVNLVEFTPEQLDRLRAAIDASYSGESAKRGFIGERAFMLSPGGPWDANLLIFMMDRARMLEVYDQLIASTEKPLRDSAALVNEIESDLGKGSRFLHPYSRIIVPPLLRALESHVRAMTQQQLVLLGCDIERYARENGALPDELDAAGIAAPDDPYGEETIRYVRDAKGYVVYSVGPDGDGESAEKPTTWPARDAESDDIVFRVIRQ